MANNGGGGQGPLTGGQSSTKGGMQRGRGRGRGSSRHGSSGSGNGRGGAGSRGRHGISECGRGRGRGGCGASRRGRGRGGCGSVRGGAGGSRQPGSDSGGPSNSSGDTRIWSTTLSDVIVKPFTKQVGPTIPIANSIEIFDTFFSDELISVIVRETNRYAKDCLKNDDTTWETNVNEIRAFIGFIVLMGIVNPRRCAICSM